jgi:hypothetical protein
MTNLAGIRALARMKGTVFVQHEPYTEAYERAAEELDTLVTHGEEIGRGEVHEHGDDGALPTSHVVVWLAPLNAGECGLYGVFKVRSDHDAPYQAELFAIYDGEQGRLGWRSREEARAWMRENHPEYVEV